MATARLNCVCASGVQETGKSTFPSFSGAFSCAIPTGADKNVRTVSNTNDLTVFIATSLFCIQPNALHRKFRKYFALGSPLCQKFFCLFQLRPLSVRLPAKLHELLVVRLRPNHVARLRSRTRGAIKATEPIRLDFV